MKYLKKFNENKEILDDNELTFPDNPVKLNGVLDWYNSKKQNQIWQYLESNNSEDSFIDLFGDENGKIRCSIEDGLNGLQDQGKWTREEIELFAKYVRKYGI
jgi:hypothetical protein